MVKHADLVCVQISLFPCPIYMTGSVLTKKITPFPIVLLGPTLLVDSANEKLVISYPENRILTFHENCLHVKSCFQGKIKRQYFDRSSAENFTQSAER